MYKEATMVVNGVVTNVKVRTVTERIVPHSKPQPERTDKNSKITKLLPKKVTTMYFLEGSKGAAR